MSMHRGILGWGLVAALALVGLAGMVGADEEKVPLDKVPAAVMRAVKDKYPDATLVGATTETENGQKMYEVTLKDKGHKVDVTATADGKIVTVEREIGDKDLPQPVVRALNRKYPKATVQRVEEVSKNDQVTAYEAVIVTADNRKLEVSFDPKGKFLEEEKKGDKDE
jgi:hypothetical protein